MYLNIIDVIDMNKKELVWRGTGTGVINPNATVEERTTNINNAVAQILAQFPPTQVQK
jgi:Holliday junction resolvasome RuvABC endonuclease subunit